MKVLFLKDVRNVGQKGTVKEVSDGYALNALIPSGQAVQATPDRIKAYEAQKAQESAQMHTREVMAESLLKRITGVSFTVHAEANEKGRLYKRVSMEAIAAVVQKETGETVPHDAFSIKNPIQELGEYSIDVTLEKSKTKIIVAVTRG